MKTTNPKSVANVNQKQGPRTGNQGLTSTKRTEFSEAKKTRAPLADTIMRAFGIRGEKTKDETNAGLEGVSASTKARFKK